MTDSSGHRRPAARAADSYLPADSHLPAVRPPGGPGPADGPAAGQPALRYQRIALVDLLDRVLAGGAVVMGDVRLAIADVDLVTISVQALISSVSTVLGDPPDDPAVRVRPPREGQADDG